MPNLCEKDLGSITSRSPYKVLKGTNSKYSIVFDFVIVNKRHAHATLVVSQLLSRLLVNYTVWWVKTSRIHIDCNRQLTIFFYNLFLYRSMRATIFNICAILSLFSVAIYADPPTGGGPVPCTKQPFTGGPGPACDPRARLPPCIKQPFNGGPGPACDPHKGPGGNWWRKAWFMIEG